MWEVNLMVKLTERQFEYYQLFKEGKSAYEIANKLKVKITSVFHNFRIFRDLKLVAGVPENYQLTNVVVDKVVPPKRGVGLKSKKVQAQRLENSKTFVLFRDNKKIRVETPLNEPLPLIFENGVIKNVLPEYLKR